MAEFTTGLDDVLQKKVIDEHLQKTLIFVQEHEKVLHEITKANLFTIDNTDQSLAKPIRLVADPQERVLPQDLLPFDQEPIRKFLLALVYICDEISQLKDIAESRFYRSLIMFGQLPPDESNSSGGSSEINGKKEKMIGNFLPFLQELSNYIFRCYALALNLVQQLAAMRVIRDENMRFLLKEIRFNNALNSLGDLLGILITLDTIITNNESLQEAWLAFKSMVSFSHQDPGSTSTEGSLAPTNDPKLLANFELLIFGIQQNIMMGEIFRNCIEQNYETTQPNELNETYQIEIRNNLAFLEGDLELYLKSSIDKALSVINTAHEDNERMLLFQYVMVYSLYRRLLPPNRPPSNTLHKLILSIQKVCPIFILSDSVYFCTADFILKYAPYDKNKNDANLASQIEVNTKAFLTQFDSTFSAKTFQLFVQSHAWLILIESQIQPLYSLNANQSLSNVNSILEQYYAILMKGLSLAKRIMYHMKYFIVIHFHLSLPLNKTNLMDLMKLFELFKAMEFSFHRKFSLIFEWNNSMLNLLKSNILYFVSNLQVKIESHKNFEKNNKRNFLFFLFKVSRYLMTLLKNSDTISVCRTHFMNLLVDVLTINSSSSTISSILAEKDISKLVENFAKLKHFGNFSKKFKEIFDCGFIYMYKDLFQPLVQHLYQNPVEIHQLPYLISIFEDGIKLCQNIRHHELTPFLVFYRNFMKKTIADEIIKPLCRDIETNLRLHIHSKHLHHMQVLNPKTENLRPIKFFVDSNTIKILGQLINIKDEVTHYLNRNFYNLTTIALHDWRTYSDMRQLAKEKFDITLMDNFLPMGSLDQGLDILQIMRNIHIFVSRFTYNMNMQQFIEYRPDKASKHLNTIKIQSIAASIRQHGLGMLNTTVNFTYQFLSSKFHIFSQFLFDDYIKANLSREHRWFKKHKNEEDVNNMYPYDRALKFVKDIKKLGVNEQGKTFLDQFRILISEIGNALGYVRMVRSASMYYCSEAVKFLPEFEDIITFEDYVKGRVERESGGDQPTVEIIEGANLTDENVNAAKNLDSVIATLVKNFGEGSDYFKVLVNIFQSVLLSAEHDHLRTFYMIGNQD